MKRVALGIALLWATVSRAADLTMGSFDVSDLSARQTVPALDANTFMGPGRSGVFGPQGGETAHAASTGQAFDALRMSFDSSTTLERSAPLAAELPKTHQPYGELGSALYVRPAPDDLSYQNTGPQSSVPQALHRSSRPLGFAGSKSDGPKLGALMLWAGLAVAGFLIIWAVTAAGNSRAA
jgi:hypothetical protein